MSTLNLETSNQMFNLKNIYFPGGKLHFLLVENGVNKVTFFNYLFDNVNLNTAIVNNDLKLDNLITELDSTVNENILFYTDLNLIEHIEFLIEEVKLFNIKLLIIDDSMFNTNELGNDNVYKVIEMLKEKALNFKVSILVLSRMCKDDKLTLDDICAKNKTYELSNGHFKLYTEVENLMLSYDKYPHNNKTINFKIN